MCLPTSPCELSDKEVTSPSITISESPMSLKKHWVVLFLQYIILMVIQLVKLTLHYYCWGEIHAFIDLVLKGH